MRRKRTCLVVFSTVIAGATLSYTGSVWATPAFGFKTTTLVKRTFAEIDVLKDRNTGAEEGPAKVPLSLRNPKRSSDLYVQNNVWRPGGSTGWHTHPGHSLIVVTEGTVTEYNGSDPDCKPHVYGKDMAFVDGGGDHVHMIRNEGKVMARTLAVQLIPAGAVRRIDVADPGNCRF